MELRAEKFVDNLLTPEASQHPSDSVNIKDLEMKLPEWFDEKKYNQGRRFYTDHLYMMSAAMVLGLIAVFSIPSILKILVGSKRTSSTYTAYKRYFSTHKHVNSWFEHELKPGSVAWRSLYTVRSRHIAAGRASKLKGTGIVSQRDVALTLYGFIGFTVLKPDRLGVRQIKEGDWEAFIHSWRVIAYMIGLEDRYNICRESFEETRQVCQILQDRVYTPCLDNVPEYFEHMSRVTLEGVQLILSGLEPSCIMYTVKCMADVPGYVFTEQERINFQIKFRKHQVDEKHIDQGVPSTAFVQECAIEGLPKRPPCMLYMRNYDCIENIPAYKELSPFGKYKLAFNAIAVAFYGTYMGRIIINYNFKLSLIIASYLPYKALWKFGVKNVFVNMFKESPTDDTIPKPNSEFYKPRPPEQWYKVILSFL